MFVKEKPLGILIEFIRGKFNLSMNEDYSKSLYKIFEKYQIQLKTADQVIEAAISTKEEMTLLGFRKKFPTLLIKRICYSTTDEPVEYVKGVYHAHNYRYFLKLMR
jgi:GntR family transcriptional regulator